MNAENKMGTMPIGKLIIKMSAPMMASMLFQALYNIVDSVFVSKLSQDALNAVSLAFPFQTFAIALATGTGVGMGALLSRSLGSGDKDGVNSIAGTGMFLYLLTMIAFSVLGFTLARPFYTFQTNNETIVEYGTQYITVCIGFCFALYGQICGERLLQSTGRTDLAMIPQIAGAVFNMVFDPILIFGLCGFPRLEVMGAAVATVCGQVLATVLCIILNLKKNKEIHFSFKLIRPRKTIIKDIYKIGMASIILQATGSLLNFILNGILISFTEAATAVFGAYYKIQSIIFMPVLGMNNAMIPIISYNYGACRTERVKRTVKICIYIAVGIMSIGTVAFESIPELLLGIFSPSEEMIEIGRLAFRTIGIHFPIAGFCIVSVSVCQALGKPMYSLGISVTRQLLGLLPIAWLLSLTGNVNAVWWAFPLAEVLSAIMSAFFMKKVFKHLTAF